MNDLEEPQFSRALPMEDALRYATSLAEALRRMHREGTVCASLDLKHIRWESQRVTLVCADADTTGAYSSPEQVRGEIADARSDIFAFGAVLYEILSGRRAFPAKDPDELKGQILASAPAPIEGIPEGVASLLSGCLEKDRGLRRQRMSSILIELKLASASAKQAAHDERLAERRAAQESMVSELRQSIQRIDENLALLHETIAGLQRSAQIHTKAIEGLEVAASQTDEVVEHVVEAFGMMHRSLVES